MVVGYYLTIGSVLYLYIWAYVEGKNVFSVLFLNTFNYNFAMLWHYVYYYQVRHTCEYVSL